MNSCNEESSILLGYSSSGRISGDKYPLFPIDHGTTMLYSVTRHSPEASPKLLPEMFRPLPMGNIANPSFRQLLNSSMDYLHIDPSEEVMNSLMPLPIKSRVRGSRLNAGAGVSRAKPNHFARSQVLPTQDGSETSNVSPSVVLNGSQDEDGLFDLSERSTKLSDHPFSSSPEDLPVAAALVKSLDLFPSRKRKSRNLEEGGRNLAPTTTCPTTASSSSSCVPSLVGQEDQWWEKLRELRKYWDENGHCQVPHNYKKNLPLARWVKRQRHQIKQVMEEGHVLSEFMELRVKALKEIGFVWDCQGSAWEEKLSELCEYCATHLDCNVPNNFPENPKLGMWVKCQRRQYKLYKQGRQSSMNEGRIQELEAIGFNWGLRNYCKKQRTS